MTTSQHVLDLSPLVLVRRVVADLVAQGWLVTDKLSTVDMSLDGSTNPRAAVALLDPLLPAAVNLDVVGSRDGARLRLRLVHQSLEVVEPLAANIDELFDDQAARDDARLSLEGDPDAALRLPLTWNVHATLALQRMLVVPENAVVTVASTTHSVTERVMSTGAADVTHLMSDGEFRVLVSLEPLGCAHIGAVTLTGIEGQEANKVTLPEVVPLPGEEPGVSWPRPVTLLAEAAPVAPIAFQESINHLRVIAAQLVWRSLATSETLDEQGDLSLTFHGYRKAAFSIPPLVEWSEAVVRSTFELRRWALHDASPDRLLAVRQVVSLYPSADAPFFHADDIRASAEIVYSGLRSTAVAEAVKSSRDAHGQAQESARQTSKNATEMLKSALERMLAALGGMGTVFIANAARILPDDVSRLLIVLVGLFLLVLAAASAILEGPLLALTSKELKADLDHQAGLLTEDQRQRIAELPSLVAAKALIRTVRWVVPLTYVAFALLLFLFARPDRYVIP